MSAPLMAVLVLLQVSLVPREVRGSGELKLQQIVSGAAQPIYLCSPPGDYDRLFVVEFVRAIQIFKRSTGALNPIPFLDLEAEGFTECRSIAFDPLFDSNGYFYVCGIVEATDVVVRRYKVSDDAADVADPDSRTAILTTMPAVGHLAGWIGFANDGMLHITTGDGSPTPTHDPENDSQNAENLIGKVLRIDVRSDDFPDDDSRNYAIPPDNPYSLGNGSPEIQAIGLRNPWRASFDRLTGDLWIGDVGQNNREEIDFVAAGDLSMKNFGWRLREGSIATPTGIYGGPRPPNNVDPVFEYGPLGGQSVTGGYVYRGASMPWLQGAYFYGDWVHNTIGSFHYTGGNASDLTDWTPALQPEIGEINGLVSFGEDAAGELYVVSMRTGSVFQITRPYLIWLGQYFSAAEIADPSVSGPAEDPDGDHLATIWEYVVGTDPKTPNPHPEDPVFDYFLDPLGRPTVRVNRDAASSDVSLRMEVSADMLSWSSGSTTVITDSDTLFEARDENGSAEANRRFARVVATLE